MSLRPLIWPINEIMMRAKVCLLVRLLDCFCFHYLGLLLLSIAGMPLAAWHSQMATLLKSVLHLQQNRRQVAISLARSSQILSYYSLRSKAVYKKKSRNIIFLCTHNTFHRVIKLQYFGWTLLRVQLTKSCSAVLRCNRLLVRTRAVS